MPCQSFCISASLDFLWWDEKQCWWETVLKSVSFPVTSSGGQSFIWMCSVLFRLYEIMCMHPYSPDLSIIWVCTDRQGHPVPIVVGALYASTTRQLHRGCHLESAFPRPPLSQWLIKLCLSSLEIIGKMWISELFNLVAKFSPVLLKLRQICLERFLLLPATKGHRIEGHRIYKQMENNFLK